MELEGWDSSGSSATYYLMDLRKLFHLPGFYFPLYKMKLLN